MFFGWFWKQATTHVCVFKAKIRAYGKALLRLRSLTVKVAQMSDVTFVPYRVCVFKNGPQLLLRKWKNDATRRCEVFAMWLLSVSNAINREKWRCLSYFMCQWLQRSLLRSVYRRDSPRCAFRHPSFSLDGAACQAVAKGQFLSGKAGKATELQNLKNKSINTVISGL